MKKLSMIVITLILCITDAEATTPPVDLSTTCETQAGCIARLKEKHENVKRHLEQRGKVGLSARQIERKVKQSCSVTDSKNQLQGGNKNTR
jgi:hypothetical protein